MNLISRILMRWIIVLTCVTNSVRTRCQPPCNEWLTSGIGGRYLKRIAIAGGLCYFAHKQIHYSRIPKHEFNDEMLSTLGINKAQWCPWVVRCDSAYSNNQPTIITASLTKCENPDHIVAVSPRDSEKEGMNCVPRETVTSEMHVCGTKDKQPITEKPTTQKPTTQKPTTKKLTTIKPPTKKPTTKKSTVNPSIGLITSPDYD